MRLTDADALLVALVHGHYIDKMQCGEIKRMVERYTIDAVPVIRCKDCKWYYRGGATCMYWDGENNMRGDDYCSQAERRNDERME